MVLRSSHQRLNINRPTQGPRGCAYDFSGKTILPFITHGGYGAGSSTDELRSLLAGTNLAEPFILQCDQERANLAALHDWLDALRNVLPR